MNHITFHLLNGPLEEDLALLKPGDLRFGEGGLLFQVRKELAYPVAFLNSSRQCGPELLEKRLFLFLGNHFRGIGHGGQGLLDGVVSSAEETRDLKEIDELLDGQA
jgi:hypothetical protein